MQWTKVPFNSSYAPGPKNFDFDINQISITPKRAEVVDFSDGYYAGRPGGHRAQGLRRARASPPSSELKGLKLGAQTGTTSLTAIRDVIQPDSDPVVFKDTNAAKQALLNGQVDAILADLPTAFYITAVEIPKGTIVGQFQPETGQQEEFGMLFEKGSPLVDCVNQALAVLREDGTLDAIEQRGSATSWTCPSCSSSPSGCRTGRPERRGRSSATRPRRRLRLRSATVATVATVVVLGLLAVRWSRRRRAGRGSGRPSSPGSTRRTSFPDVLKGFWKNVLLFLIAEPLILVLGALVAVVRSTTAAAAVPAAAAGGLLHRPVPWRADACSS